MGNLIASFDVMLRVALIPHGSKIMAETTETLNFDEFKGEDCVFVAECF